MCGRTTPSLLDSVNQGKSKLKVGFSITEESILGESTPYFLNKIEGVFSLRFYDVFSTAFVISGKEWQKILRQWKLSEV